jgi:hypothetical protein
MNKDNVSSSPTTNNCSRRPCTIQGRIFNKITTPSMYQINLTSLKVTLEQAMKAQRGVKV